MKNAYICFKSIVSYFKFPLTFTLSANNIRKWSSYLLSLYICTIANKDTKKTSVIHTNNKTRKIFNIHTAKQETNLPYFVTQGIKNRSVNRDAA